MKWFLHLFVYFLIVQANAQTVTRKLTPTTVIQQRSIYLNGGTNASFGGTSRVAIPIQLPANTKSWYYSFTTSPGVSGTEALNLSLQLASMTTSGLTSVMLSSIKVPPGSNSLDVNLLDAANERSFIEKVDNWGGTYKYYPLGSVKNTKQAVVEVRNWPTGLLYLGLRNPSSLDGLNVQLEVVAIVETVEQSSEMQSKAITVGNLAWKAFERGDVEKCLELSENALRLDPSLGYVKFNVALCQLIKGQNTEATMTYVDAVAISKTTPVARETIAGAIDDIKNNLLRFPSQGDARDILELLKEELQQL